MRVKDVVIDQGNLFDGLWVGELLSELVIEVEIILSDFAILKMLDDL
jgi:hypothetical protein